MSDGATVANPVKSYDVKFTRLAKAILGDSVSAAEEKLRGELARTLPEEVYPPEIFFHCFKHNERDFIAKGKGDHLLVDSATYEEMDEPLTQGRFKGKRIQFPTGDSEE